MGEWAKRWEKAQSKANVWWLKSDLDLWSNFQYCLNAGCPPGDQFKQAERRQAGGFAVSHAMFDHWRGFEVENSIGLQGRIDDLNPVGLYTTSARQTLGTVREDKVTQRSLGLWVQNETRWTEWFRSVQGLRADTYDFTVDSNLAANSGKASDQMVTPKLAPNRPSRHLGDEVWTARSPRRFWHREPMTPVPVRAHNRRWECSARLPHRHARRPDDVHRETKVVQTDAR